MIRRTLKDVRPELARLASVSGISSTDPRIIAAINIATEELMNAGDWPGVVDRYRFRLADGHITLPADLDRIMGVAVDSMPVEMRSPWFEFVQGGPGVSDGNKWLDVALDRGEVCTFAQVPNDGMSYKLVLISDVDERVSSQRPKLIVNGYDESGRFIIGGVQLDINGDTVPRQTVSSINVTAVESVIKPVTKGYIHLFADSGANTVQLASYAPGETNPSYRRYFIPAFSDGTVRTALIRARRRFIPIRSDNDFLIISNMPALAWMMKAVAKRDADKTGEYLECRRLAIGILAEEASSYHGKTINPAMTFSRGFCLGNMPNIQ